MNDLLSPRARAFANEAGCPRGMGYSNAWPGVGNATMSNATIAGPAAGMGGYDAPPPWADNASVWHGVGLGDVVPQHDASDVEKNQISRWALAAGKDDRDAYRAAVSALSRVSPWGDEGPNWYTTVANGGWYAYSKVTEMLSTTIAERHPDWLTAVGAAVGTQADLSVGGGAVGASVGSPTTVDVDAISRDVVNTGGAALNRAADAASSGAVAAQKSWAEWWASYKWMLLLGGAGLVVVGGGAVYAHGRGMRRPNPRGTGRRASSSPLPPRVARRPSRLARRSA